MGKETSRLTGGTELDVPLTNYTVTYLYKDNKNNNNFIRGWHGLLHNAFYLPEVFLENTFENGTWIKSNDKEWPQTTGDDIFNLSETLVSLNAKAGLTTGGAGLSKKRTVGKKKNKTLNIKKFKGGSNVTLFNSKVLHYSI